MSPWLNLIARQLNRGLRRLSLAGIVGLVWIGVVIELWQGPPAADLDRAGWLLALAAASLAGAMRLSLLYAWLVGSGLVATLAARRALVPLAVAPLDRRALLAWLSGAFGVVLVLFLLIALAPVFLVGLAVAPGLLGELVRVFLMSAIGLFAVSFVAAALGAALGRSLATATLFLPLYGLPWLLGGALGPVPSWIRLAAGAVSFPPRLFEASERLVALPLSGAPWELDALHGLALAGMIFVLAQIAFERRSLG